MNEQSIPPSQQTFQVVASLPFPLRLSGGPFRIASDNGEASLSFETVRQDQFDGRLHIERFDGDFELDRQGWASYTKLSGEVRISGQHHVLHVLLDCLNKLIRQLRDVAELFWLYELEEVDLFRLSIESAGIGQTAFSWGRTEGVHARVEGLIPAAEQVIATRLANREQVLEWRLLYLDAQDAFSLGKYEQAVLLGWSALEVACRTETPKLARAASLSPADLRSRVDPDSKQAPFSLEEVTERAPILDLVSVCCELANASHDPGSLAQSTKTAWHLRNVVSHRGIRLSRSQAARALNEVGFVFGAMRLPTGRAPGTFDDVAWIEHFGTSSLDLSQWLGLATGRIVPFKMWREERDPLTCWFQLERSDDLLAVRFQDDMTESIAAALTVVTNDSYGYGGGMFPYLAVSEHAPPVLISGLLQTIAGSITEAAHWSHAALVREAAGLPIQSACDYAVDKIWRAFTRLDHTIEPHDGRFLSLGTRMASYVSHASQQAMQRFRQGMAPRHSALSDCARDVSRILSNLDATDPHSICPVLRELHQRWDLQGQLMWLDTLVVRCPREAAEYGTTRRTLA